MKYRITAQAYERYTFQKVGKEREEVIDADENSLFTSVLDDPFEIRQRYEHFWNDVNPNSTEKIFVTNVTKIR